MVQRARHGGVQLGAVTANEAACLERAVAFTRDVVDVHAARWDREGTSAPREIVARAAEAGLCGLRVPRDLGGEGLSATATARVVEELAAGDLAAAFVLVVHNNAAGIVASCGTPTQIARHLPSMVEGRSVGAFLLTEPSGGSDAAALTTRATPDGSGGWLLDGEKSWITSASCADVLNTYAQTDPALGWRGIAAFLVEGDRPGVVRSHPYPMLGAGAAGTGSIRFEGCRLTTDHEFVTAGAAFKVAMAGIDLARVLVAAMACGMLQRGLAEAIAWTTGRRAFGRRLADFQGLQWQLADVASDLFAARTSTYAAAAALDGRLGDSDADRDSDTRGDTPSDADTVTGRDADRHRDGGTSGSGVGAGGRARWPTARLAAAHAKKLATRAALRGLADCTQALGASGLRLDLGHPLARHLAAAKVAQYLDGTTEIQNVVISRSLFGVG